MTYESTKTIRANEARHIFGAAGEGIVWALLDSGIHRNHVHFKQHENLILPSPLQHADFSAPELAKILRKQRHADFSAPELAEILRQDEALLDSHGHGTHVAGIICGESRFEDIHYLGVAPMCKLLSVKIFDESGNSNEKNILAALEWIKWVNLAASQLIIHGLTLNGSLSWDVRNFACGLTPVCEAVNDLVRSGVVVVVPAGNFGYRVGDDTAAQATVLGSISDPGNAELAITVGSTHPRVPHDYGASYFSSRGPTIDGRLKPDLLAPGERIDSCWVDPQPPAPKGGKRNPQKPVELQSYLRMDGTAMASAHVAGAVALLLSARPELIGRPLQVKHLLMETTTDLKRVPWAQGRGLVDVVKLISTAQEPEEPGLVTTPTRRTERQPIPAMSEERALLPEDQRVSPIVPTGGKRFVIALSFPGTHRKLVTDVARELRVQMPGLLMRDIFLDSYHSAELARPDFDTYLQNIYVSDSELLIVFLGGDYEKSDWCSLEWRVVRDLIKTRRGHDVMLLRLDLANIPGLLSIDGYLDVHDWEADVIATKIIERFQLNFGTHIAEETEKWGKVIRVANIKAE